MNKLYQDPLIEIALSDKPCAFGHLIVTPTKESYKIEDLSDDEVKHLFYGASYSATALFELLGAHGTNIILTELSNEKLNVNVIARKENDGLNFQWNPIKGNPLELKEVAKKIKDEIDMIKWHEEHPEENKKIVEDKKENILVEKENKINYLLKNLERKP